MADILEVPAVTVRPDPTRPGQGATDPLPTRTVPLPDEPGLDLLYIQERQKADAAERNDRLVGRYLNDPLIQATQAGIQAVQQGAQAVKDTVQPALDQAGSTIAKDVLPVVADDRFGMLGTGVTTGGVMTGNPALAVTGLGMLGMMKVGKGLLRQRFNVEEITQRALNPSPLAERVTEAVNSKTPVLTDEAAQAEAQQLLKSGGVTRSTLEGYAPGTALLSAPQALAAQAVVTAESRAFIDIARQAVDTNDPQLADQALTVFSRLLNPAANYAGAVTTTAQTLRVASSEDVKAMNLILERLSKTSEGMAPLDILKQLLADPNVDPAKQGKSLTQSFRNVMTQAQEIAAQGDQAQAQLFLHELEQTVAEEAQLSMFPDDKAVKEAQKVYKTVTEQHIVEANKAAAEKADKDTFKLTPTGPHQPKAPQTNYIKEQDKAHLATIKEHQAQDLRMSEGTSVFSPKREAFKLTPPPGGARRPPKPKQLDLLNIIAKEPEPEQLALEMAASIEHPELSKEFLSLIKKTQKAIESGSKEDIGKVLAKIQGHLTPKAQGDAVAQPQRLTAIEKKAISQFIVGAKQKNMSDTDMLKALVLDPSLQPDALINAINNAKNPTWRDAWQHLLINAMLTPASDFINFTATASMVPAHVAARSIAARTGKVAQMLGGKAGVLVGEDEAMIHGMYSSFWDSVKLAGRVLKTYRPEIGPAAVREEALKDNPMTANAMFGYSPTARKLAGVSEAPTYDSASYPVLSRAGAVSQAINFFGVATGLPGRLMLTGDQFVQSMAMNGEMHAQVYRKSAEQAVREGLSEKDFYKSYRPLWRSMQQRIPDDIRAAGEEFSLEVSLNKKLGPLGSQVLGLREKANEFTGIGGTIALPFFKTLVNSAKATWEFSPLAPASSALGLVSKQFRDDMFGDDPVKRDLAVGKWAFGSMLMSSMVWAAFNGRLTGRGPDSKALRDAGYEAEGLPDSFVYNTDTGERVQINRLGVLSNLAGMAADAAEIWPIADDQTKADIAQLLTTAYVGNLSFDFMLNSAQVVEALANGVKKKEDLVVLAKAVGGSMIPLSGTIRSMEKLLSDEPLLVKDARDTMDKILARFPGYDSLAKQFGMDPVPVKRNQFGDAVKQPRSAYGTEWFNPMYISAPSTDPVMQRLATVEKELKLEIGPPAMTTGKNNLPMTAQEYDKYQWLAGKRWRERASAIIDILEDKNTLDQVKRNLIETHLRLARQTAQRELLGSEPNLVDSLVQDTQTRYSTLRTPKKTLREPLTLNPE